MQPNNPAFKLTEREIADVNAIRLAKYFGKLPHEIRAAPARDMMLALSVWDADEKIEEIEAKRRK